MMENVISQIPLLQKSKIEANEEQAIACCAQPADNTPCCKAGKSAEEDSGACCAQPEDGSACCER